MKRKCNQLQIKFILSNTEYLFNQKKVALRIEEEVYEYKEERLGMKVKSSVL